MYRPTQQCKYDLQEEVPLLEPDVLVCSVGTEIFFESSAGSEPVPDSKWIELLNRGWDREAVLQAAANCKGLSLQVRTHRMTRICFLTKSSSSHLRISAIVPQQQNVRDPFLLPTCSMAGKHQFESEVFCALNQESSSHMDASIYSSLDGTPTSRLINLQTMWYSNLPEKTSSIVEHHLGGVLSSFVRLSGARMRSAMAPQSEREGCVLMAGRK